MILFLIIYAIINLLIVLFYLCKKIYRLRYILRVVFYRMLMINIILSWYIVVVYNWIMDFNINDEFLGLKIIYILIFLPFFFAAYNLKKVNKKETCSKCGSGNVKTIESAYHTYYKCMSCGEVYRVIDHESGGWPD